MVVRFSPLAGDGAPATQVVHLRGAPILSILVLKYLLPNAAVRYVVFGLFLALSRLSRRCWW
jgi:hypothetical protein